MSFLLDTNVVSELRRGRDPNVSLWASSIQDQELHLSVLTLGEVRKGIERLRPRDPVQADAFDAWLEMLRTDFVDRILPVDERVAQRWGRLSITQDRPVVDSLIAATALVHGLTVATRNIADFEGCGAPLFNPWLPRPDPSSTL
ncbi:MAG: type II toxin-antitoxin system VapC family toxin [Acidimicrobiales bacterium]